MIRNLQSISSKVSIRPFSRASILYKISDIRLTLYSKPNCGLCEEAKEIIQEDILSQEKFKRYKVKLKIVNIDDLKNKKWWIKYCFDVPVLHIENESKKGQLERVFHKMDEKEILDKIEKMR
ncbi:Mgp12p NDAI_0C03970 [Naumovozyma dairenensis CBS 421]|uniref:Glutaredoxin-like protein n=1 Tax=Naumovozyma dairenensis (strain ATCC 10597 / BCRC 20456 / CBS 421 / NBRC 0211 / NRRL Y-12639) TaxID=1071378 RepID=G0W8E6_NAUDC|nr:hypothetical protein NDAI_0C03970 [Naumovozyma dairenensis CBS 421]CCD24057.1 hypothetical protein NDAI_0C03970 [Naumovozyma dairenensis CBS 421]